MSNPTKPSVDIVENDNSTSIDVIDSTSKNKFLWHWLKETDEHGDFLSKYIRKLNKDGVAWCSFCECELKYATRGKSTLLAHAKTKKDSFLCLHKELVHMHVRNGMKAMPAYKDKLFFCLFKYYLDIK